MRSVNSVLLFGMFFGAVLFGSLDWAIFDLYSNRRNQSGEDQQFVIQSFIELVGLAFSIFTGWILYQVEQEQKDVGSAVAAHDYRAFEIAAQHRMSPTLYIFEGCGALLLIVGFHFFHIDSRAVSLFIVGGSGFLISLLFLYLIDLDNPINGAVNIRIPRSWKQRLKDHHPTIEE